MSCADRPKKETEDIINELVDKSSDLMEEYFPKGECEERGKALVFNAKMISNFSKELEKAKLEAKIEVLEEVLSVLDGERLDLHNNEYEDGVFAENRYVYREVQKMLDVLKKK